jgi:hypothetical protein
MQTFTFKRAVLCGGVAVAVCVASTFSASAQTNFVTDPSFELGTPRTNGGWTAFSGAVLNSTGHVLTGTKAVRLPAGNGVGAFETISNVAFTAGTQFELTAWGFVTNTMTAGFVGIQATFFNVTGFVTNNLGTVESGPGNARFSNHLDSNSVLNTWILLDTGVFTAPSSMPISYIQVFPLAVNGGSTGGSVWEDDFNLVIVPEPSTLLLGGFGLMTLFLVVRCRRQA